MARAWEHQVALHCTHNSILFFWVGWREGGSGSVGLYWERRWKGMCVGLCRCGEKLCRTWTSKEFHFQIKKIKKQKTKPNKGTRRQNHQKLHNPLNQQLNKETKFTSLLMHVEVTCMAKDKYRQLTQHIHVQKKKTQLLVPNMIYLNDWKKMEASEDISFLFPHILW